MSQPPLTIALFKPDEAILPLIQRVFQRSEYKLITVSVPADLLRHDAAIDLAVIPSRLASGAPGVTLSLQMKAIDELTPLPIVAMSANREQAALEALFGAGADLVLVEPFDSSHIALQLHALVRRRRAYDEQLTRSQESAGLRHSAVDAFNAVREGIIIASAQLDPFFANQAAATMLGLSKSDDTRELQTIFEQFHCDLAQLQNGARANTPLVTERMVVRSDGRHFPARIHLQELNGAGPLPAGYVLTLTDRTEIEHLAHMLVQSERLQTLALILLSACRILLKSPSLGTPAAPLRFLENVLLGETLRCEAQTVVSSLVENFDIIVDPSASIRISVDDNLQVAVKSSDLIQILGHMLFFATEFAGPRGTIEVLGRAEGGGTEAAFLMVAESNRVTPFLPNDHISDLLQRDFSLLPAEGQTDSISDSSAKKNPLSFGLRAAQAIADKYRADIEIKLSSERLLKLRVRLPLG
jgi:PAS domain-containing protein